MVDVSFIITNYNYEQYVSDCISSCFMQKNTSLSYEVIVVDDGSVDNSLEKILKHKGCKLLRSNNAGVEIAANLGIASANGSFVVRVDADDLISPHYLSAVQDYISTDFDVLYGNYSEIDFRGNVLCDVQIPSFDAGEIYKRGDFLATGTLYRKSTITTYGPYNSFIKNNGLENYELIIKLLLNNHNFTKVDINLFSYRHHDKNMSITRRDNIMSYGKRIFVENGLGQYKIGEYHPYMKRKI